jgi:hypothetical protein
VTEPEIKQVVQAVLEAEAETRTKNLDDVVLKAVATILTSFGIEEEDRIELRADFVHLRKWRKSVEQAQSLTFKTAITIIVGGVLGAVWMGVKVMLGK